MLKQLQPVMSKVHDCPAPQNPSHSGASASPHAVVRHSQAPPEVTAEQCPPLPPHCRVSESKSQGLGASVVVVVETIVSVVRVPGAQKNCAALNRTTLVPPNRSVISAVGGKGLGQTSLWQRKSPTLPDSAMQASCARSAMVQDCVMPAFVRVTVALPLRAESLIR